MQLILHSMHGSSGKPRCSRTWLSNLGINKGKLSARAKPLRWTFSSKCNREVMTSSEGLNQNPYEILYTASSIAPLCCTYYCNGNKLVQSTWCSRSICGGSCLRKSIGPAVVSRGRQQTISLCDGWGHCL